MNGILHFLMHVLMQYAPFVFFVVVLVKQIELPVLAVLFLIAAGGLVGTGDMALGVAVGLTVVAALWGGELRHQLGRRGQYLLHNGLGTIFCVGSGIGIGYLFSERSDLADRAISLAIQVGPLVGLSLLGSMAAYGLYKSGHSYRVSQLAPRLSAVCSERASRAELLQRAKRG